MCECDDCRRLAMMAVFHEQLRERQAMPSVLVAMVKGGPMKGQPVVMTDLPMPMTVDVLRRMADELERVIKAPTN
jgi:hypothetical protein